MTKAISKPDVWADLLDIAQIRAGPTSATKTLMASGITTNDSNELRLCGDCVFFILTDNSMQCLYEWN